MRPVEDLKHHLQQMIKFTDHELEEIISHFHTVTLTKKENFVTHGHANKQIAYIEKGSVIYLKTDLEGNQVAIDFGFEGEWAAHLQSFLLEQPADIDIVANEETILNIIFKKKLYQLYERYPKMERLGRILLERGFVKIVRGFTTFQTMDNQERYLYVMKHNPKILQRIPQYHVATYLGIQPESLSRIRRKLAK